MMTTLPAPETRDQRPKVNTSYFHDLLRDREISLRTLAKKIDLEPGALSLTFHGKRAMKLREASEIATILGVPLKDVLANAGVENVGTGERTIPIVGVLRGSNTASIDFSKETDRVPGPPDLPEVAYAVLAQTALTELAPIDGSMFFVGQAQRDVRLLIGRLVFAKPAGETEAVHGYLTRSHRPGLYNLRHYVGQPREGVEIDWAAPVLWIRPQ